MPKKLHFDALIIGSGIVGISAAYYLKKAAPASKIGIVDMGSAMALTTAQSGENYRNWWPHPVMTAFMDHSIDLMEEIAQETDNLINLKRRGYVLATRSQNLDTFLEELLAGYAENSQASIRVHERGARSTYCAPLEDNWQSAPIGVDVVCDPQLIRKTFPSFDQDVENVVHIRRGGDVSIQQMGQYMLNKFRVAGGHSIAGKVISIVKTSDFQIELDTQRQKVATARLVNAAGPFINTIAGMLGISLPVKNVLQQKIAFEDTASAIPRQMPFSIDLDRQLINWSDEERAELADDADFDWLAREMPGAVHCRPEGGDRGTWVKLGWAFNETPEQPSRQPVLSEPFPEVVLRGAARLNPSLQAYFKTLPRNMHHYGGYYTMTEENWPLIGKMKVEGSFIVGAMSGFGTMAACAAGELCARWVTESHVPEYAHALAPGRYDDQMLMQQINVLSSRGIL